MNRGYIALSMILVITALVLGIATTTGLLAVGEAQSSLSLAKGEETLAFVEGCTDDAILKARTNATYTGGTITHPEGTCTVSISKSNGSWTLTVSTAATQYRRTIQAVINQSGYGVIVVTWKEI